MKPENVTLHRANGTVLNCELAHKGVDENGMDCWEIANATCRAGDEIHIGVFPPRTALEWASAPRASDTPK